MGIGVGALQAHTLSARVASGVLGVDANIYGVTRLDEATTAGSRSVDVAHISIGRVLALQRGEISIHIQI